VEALYARLECRGLTAGTVHSLHRVLRTARATPIDLRVDWKRWKELLAEAGLRDARLHEARHTAGTLLLVQGVNARTVMDVTNRDQD